MDAATIARVGCDEALLAVKGWSPATSMEFATTLEYNDEALVRNKMKEIVDLLFSSSVPGKPF